jgi:hypothetical protein
LSEVDRCLNSIISGTRIIVENTIAGVKRCRIVKDVFRNTKEGFSDSVMEVACALHNLRVECRHPKPVFLLCQLGIFCLLPIMSTGQYDMRFQSTQRIYNTRLAHEATEYAREHGKGNELHRALFRRVYAEGGDPSQWDILRAAAGEAGLDADEMQAEVESGTYTGIVEDQVRSAYRIGVTGVPTYVINDRYAIVGAQPYDVFKSTLGQILKEES